ncbi:hypothetical protein ACWECW_18440 [Rhodococcus ruber]
MVDVLHLEPARRDEPDDSCGRVDRHVTAANAVFEAASYLQKAHMSDSSTVFGTDLEGNAIDGRSRRIEDR